MLLAQIGIGIATVLLDQPIVLATAHNAMAALLLATLVVAAMSRQRSGAEWQPFAISICVTKSNSGICVNLRVDAVRSGRSQRGKCPAQEALMRIRSISPVNRPLNSILLSVAAAAVLTGCVVAALVPGPIVYVDTPPPAAYGADPGDAGAGYVWIATTAGRAALPVEPRALDLASRHRTGTPALLASRPPEGTTGCRSLALATFDQTRAWMWAKATEIDKVGF